MPNISIKEINRTSAGTPGEYGNITVLIPGYKGTPDSAKGESISADFNGAYEFTSQGDFLATIGEAAAEKKDADGKIVELHYGNRMAKYLLELGYPIIYKPINSVHDMDSQAFWADFKDRANYDFRFISHGLLETCYDVDEHTALYNELKVLKQDAERFDKIIADVDKKYEGKEMPENAYEQEYLRVIAEAGKKSETGAYEGEGEGYTGFIDPRSNVAYGAWSNVIAAFAKVEDEVPAISNKLDEIDEHNAQHITPTVFNNINGHIAQLASYIVDQTTGEPYTSSNGRGDCIALIELDEDEYCEKVSTSKPEVLIANGIDNMPASVAENGKYCAMTVPSVYYKISGDIVKLPGAFHYLACFMNSLKSGFAEWYAAAGYTRGVSSYTIDHTSVRLGEIAINALEPRTNESNLKFACNVIANFRGSYYLWGNRTAHKLDVNGLTAEHFLNIRQLCSTIKKQLYVSCRRFTFDPNSDTLWYNFIGAITPTLERMKADQGVRDYKIIKVYTDKKATLKAKIRIIPIEAVEDFDLEISLEDSFGETVATVNG